MIALTMPADLGGFEQALDLIRPEVYIASTPVVASDAFWLQSGKVSTLLAGSGFEVALQGTRLVARIRHLL
jgi:hypothetical protein